MGAGWVAGSVRGRLLARHRLGPDDARALAAGSDDGTIEHIHTAYAHALSSGDGVEARQHAVWASVLWNLRVLAGWLPADGVEAMRVFAAFFEIRNIEGLLSDPAHREPAFDLGTLATSWTRVRGATDPTVIRDELARSPWRDPGSDDRAMMLWNLRLEWARRLGDLDDAWGAGFAALVVAHQLVQRDLPVDADVARHAPALGRRIVGATSLHALQAALPDIASWVFADVERHETLWRAEARWWRRLEHDGVDAVRSARPGKRVVVGVAALLMVDAWRTSAAVEVASRHGRGEEVLDAAT